jgi:hypothetical protein
LHLAFKSIYAVTDLFDLVFGFCAVTQGGTMAKVDFSSCAAISSCWTKDAGSANVGDDDRISGASTLSVILALELRFCDIDRAGF